MNRDEESEGRPRLSVTPAEVAVYRATARRRWERERQALARRQERGWEVARWAATLLKEQFGASRVVVCGSLLQQDGFTHWSDVDLAAWGLRPEDTFRAMGAVADLDDDMAVSLVDMGACRPSLLAAIERGGREL
jgi:predicted nucleotidyltransferase